MLRGGSTDEEVRQYLNTTGLSKTSHPSKLRLAKKIAAEGAPPAVDGGGEEENAAEEAVSLRLADWTAEKFTEMCIFGGTDYKEPVIKIKGFGLKTAYRMLKRF